MNSPGVFLGYHSLSAGNGGIARVARLMARVVTEEVAAGSVRALLLGDAEAPPDLPMPVELAHNSKIRFVWASLLARRACRHFLFDGCHLAQAHALPPLRRMPMMTFIHGVEIWEQTKPGYVASARRASLLLANSQFTLQRTEALHGSLPRARVCWLATEADTRPELPAARNRPQVLIVGRLEHGRYKGHRELIACWPQVVAAVPGAILCIIGQGPDGPELQRLVAGSPVREQICFRGYVLEAEMDQAFRQAQVFAMPSRGEGFGLVYIEAMRHGLPVIASRHDAAPEIVRDGETGYTVDLDCPGELAERLIYLLREPDVAARMGRVGQQQWEQHFRFSSFRERFRPLLREFLNM